MFVGITQCYDIEVNLTFLWNKWRIGNSPGLLLPPEKAWLREARFRRSLARNWRSCNCVRDAKSISASVHVHKSANYARIVIVYTRACVISQLDLRARIVITVYTSTRAHHHPTGGYALTKSGCGSRRRGATGTSFLKSCIRH